MSKQRELSQEEQSELFSLLLFRVLLSTHIDSWKERPNEVVALAIPEEVREFVSGFNNSQATLDGIIVNLVMKGIASIAKEVKNHTYIDAQIHNILQDGDVIQ